MKEAGRRATPQPQPGLPRADFWYSVRLLTPLARAGFRSPLSEKRPEKDRALPLFSQG